MKITVRASGTLELRRGGSVVQSRKTGAETLTFDNLPVGTYTIRMTYSGGKSEEKTVTVKKGGSAAAAFDYRETGSLRVSTVSAGTLEIRKGTTSVASRELGAGASVPLSNFDVGIYTIRIIYTDGKSEERTVTVSTGDATAVAFATNLLDTLLEVRPLAAFGFFMNPTVCGGSVWKWLDFIFHFHTIQHWL